MILGAKKWDLKCPNPKTDHLVPDRGVDPVLENVGGATDLGLAEEEEGVAVQEGEELLHQVGVEEKLLLDMAFVVRGHILCLSV